MNKKPTPSIRLSIVTLLFLSLNSCYTESRFNQLGDPIAIGSPASVPTCPNGYISVPSDSSVGVNDDFCVMKYEAKAWNDVDSDGVIDSGETDADGCNEVGCTTTNWGIGTYLPGSGEEGHPWRQMNQVNAKDLCLALNTETSKGDIVTDSNGDGTYALISNPEWMAIAKNIENVAANWTDGSVGSGCLLRGNVGTTSCTGGDSGYDGPDPDSGSGRSDNGTARLSLDNGEEIWDFSGNVWEWVDWDMSYTLLTIATDSRAFVSSDRSTVPDWREFTNLDTNISDGSEMFLESWQATDSSLDGNDGIGRYYGGRANSGGAAIRGGDSSDGTDAGAFALSLEYESTNESIKIGFRCVYRP